MQRWKDAKEVRSILERHGLGELLRPETADSAELRAYADGERVCAIGERLDGLYLLVEGRLKIYTLQPNGKSMLVRFARPPAMIGDVEWMAAYPVRNMVETVGNCTLLALGRERLLEREMDNPVFLRFMIKHLSHKLYTLGGATAMNVLYPVENRVASYLLTLLSDDSGDGDAEEIRTSRLTETAELLGTSYRHLNRVINRLVASGVLERKRGRLLVRDEARLRELADNHLYT